MKTTVLSLSAAVVLGSLVTSQSAGAQVVPGGPYRLQMSLGQYSAVNLNPNLDAALDGHLANIVTHNPGDPAQVSTGAVIMVARRGKVVYLKSQGLRDGNTALGGDPNVAMNTSTIFDLESMTKPFTAAVILKMNELGLLDIAAPVEDYDPDFYYIVDQNNPNAVCPGSYKGDITVQELLRYTSGLDVDVVVPLYDRTDANVNGSDTDLQMSHEPALGPPSTSVWYSDLGYRLLGRVAERAYAAQYPNAKKTLRELVQLYITGPLQMADTDYEPVAFMPSKMSRVAGTAEFAHHDLVPNVPGGYRRGEVQDDQDWWAQRHNSLFPNATAPTGTGCDGLFSTALDLGKFAQMLLNNGQYITCTGKNGVGCTTSSLLSSWSVQKLTTVQTVDANTNALLGEQAPVDWTFDLLSADKAFGFELARNRDFSVGGHWLTGFSKTGGAGTFVIGDPADELFIVVLTNHGLPDFGDFFTSFDDMLEEIGPHRIADSVAGAILDPVAW